MTRYLLTFLLLIFSLPMFAEEGTVPGLQLATAPINRNDIDSIKRGAKFFATNCMSCHTLIYLRNDPIAKEAGITLDKMPINVKTWPYDVTPPDLTLEANVRGVNWIYTYLHSFYLDSKRPTGVNNLLLPNLAMANILAPYQGEQVLVEKPIADIMGHYEWYDLVKLTKQGTMTPDDFDAAMADVVNFLAYAAEPYQAEQHRIGWWVLGFLCVMFVLMYMLKKEYWKDVKKLK